jgi:hypothetical protein
VKKIALLILGVVMFTSCAQHKSVMVTSVTPTLKDWTSDLAVPPGTSMKGGQEQIIRLKSIKDFREFEGKFWVAGKGFASINGGSGTYFWGSSTPPQLEIEVSDKSIEVFNTCEALVAQALSQGQMLFLEGEGYFRNMEQPQGLLGVFKIFKISKCQVGSSADYEKDSK